MSDSASPDRLWSVGDVAAYLDVPVSSVYKMTGKKARLRIPHLRIAGRLRFRKTDIDRWLELLTVSDVDVLGKAVGKARVRSHGFHPPQETT